jgi:hypothetical protein
MEAVSANAIVFCFTRADIEPTICRDWGSGTVTFIEQRRSTLLLWFVLVYGVLRHFQQYFSYIVVVSFIGGGNRSSQRKPLSFRKPLTNIIT